MIIQVSSHRRSGTHALIDLIRENFAVQSDFYHLEDILDWSLEKLKESRIIIKTHEPEPEKKLKLFINQQLISQEKAQELSDMTVNVHIYRHPKDVLKSLYYFNIRGHEPVYQIPRETSFTSFLKQEGVQDANPNENRVEFWQRCVKNWVFRKDLLAINYQTLLDEKEAVITKLSQHINIEPTINSNTKPLEKKSTAIGRDTTKIMDKTPLWVEEAESYYQQKIDNKLLKKLNFKE